VIVGIGVDVVDIARFEVTLQRTPQMRARLFTLAEQSLSLQSLAARFAAKEALAKALGAPTGLVWTDAEVVLAESGAPELVISGTVHAAAQLRGVRRWHLSLAHDGGIATAIVLAEG
jgi:holo-[acyl-carrier protein] synthase